MNRIGRKLEMLRLNRSVVCALAHTEQCFRRDLFWPLLDPGNIAAKLSAPNLGGTMSGVPSDRPYMDAPGLPSFQLVMAGRNRLHPYIRTLNAAVSRCP